MKLEDFKHKILTEPELIDSLLEVFPDLRDSVFDYLERFSNSVMNDVCTDLIYFFPRNLSVADHVKRISLVIMELHTSGLNLEQFENISLEFRSFFYHNTKIITVKNTKFLKHLPEFNNLTHVFFVDISRSDVPKLWTAPVTVFSYSAAPIG